MKKITFLLLISFVILNSSYAQRGIVGEKATDTEAESVNDNTKSYPKDNELRVGFFDFFNSEFLLSYEHLFDNNTGVVINGGMILEQTSYEEKIGGEGELQYRLYLRPDYKREPGFSFNGIYTGPYVFYKYLDKTTTETNYDYSNNNYNPIITTTTTNANYSTIGAGVIVGIKFVIAHRITIDINGGGGLRYTDTHPKGTNISSDVFSDGYTGIAPKGRVTFGLRF